MERTFFPSFRLLIDYAEEGSHPAGFIDIHFLGNGRPEIPRRDNEGDAPLCHQLLQSVLSLFLGGCKRL